MHIGQSHLKVLRPVEEIHLSDFNLNLRGGKEEGMRRYGGALAEEGEISVLVPPQVKSGKTGD